MAKGERKRISQATREDLLKNANFRCVVCGSASPLELRHIVPISLGGTVDPSNLTVVCANCNRSIASGLYEPHFVQYLAGLIRQHPNFNRVDLEELVGQGSRLRADIVAQRKTHQGSQRLIIECKGQSVLSGPRLAAVISQLSDYVKVGGEATVVLAFPGRANEQALKEFARLNIEVWDIDKIAELFRKQIAATDDPYFTALFQNSRIRATPQEKFIKELKECPAGHDSWMEYQKLIGRILIDLFCPPLTNPLEEHADAARANRRDFVFPNYAADSFWQFIRTRYAADYIVVDAKNGKGKITKTHVLQIANYLKEHGVGMFGIILCRNGIKSGAKVTMREQWLLHDKMIIALNDLDLENMLLAKAAGGDPVAVISDRIQQFRLSM
jgi:hypothetical protein